MWSQQNSFIRIIFLAGGCLIVFLPLRAGQISMETRDEDPGHVVINEVLASNSHTNYDVDFGAYSDWIELYNPTGSEVDMEGWYLSDDPTDPGKWRIPGNTVIPANAYLLFWADNKDLRPGQFGWTEFTTTEQITIQGYHLNFRIKNEREELLLTNSQGQRVDSVLLTDQQRNFSSGKDGEGSWCYLGESTPLAGNSNNSVEEFILSGIPVFSISGGLYPGSLQLELEGPGAGSVIRYTTDGSEPNTLSSEYTGPISLLFSQVVKARLFEAGKLPGKVLTESYIIHKVTSLPVISVSTDHNNLWGFDFGLYQRNLKNREVFAHLEYFDESGTKAFHINAGLQLFGSQIVLFDQKPFSIFFRKRYGQDSLNYNLFKNREVDTYYSLVLRNGGNDNNLTMIRDGLGATLVENQMDLDYQSFQPVVVYMNGDYWGIFHLREKLNEEYLETNHDINPVHVDILEDSLRVNNGDANHYQDLIDFVSDKDLSTEEDYNYVAGKMDIDQFMNYMSFKIYGGYSQWQVNSKYWRERTPASRWRWIAFDLEHCFAGPGGDTYETNTLSKVLESGEGSSAWFTLLFQKLMENEKFRATFLQRSTLFMGTVFDEGRVTGVIDSLKGLIENEMENHIARWNSPVSRDVWLQHMASLEEFARLRNRHLLGHLMDYFSIPDTSRLTLQCGNGGKIVLAGALVMEPGTDSYTLLNILPISLIALPEPGYVFTGWNGIDPGKQMDLILSGDTVLFAQFQPSTDHLLPDTISGTLILNDVSRPYFSSGHVFVPAGDTLIIGEGVEIRMKPDASLICEGYLFVEGHAEKMVRIDVNPSVVKNYLSSNRRKWGGIIIRSSDSVIIRHLHLKNASSGDGAGSYKGAISAVESNLSLSGVQISGVKNPIWCLGSFVRIDSCRLSSCGTGDLINLVDCHSPMIMNNHLSGNYYEDTDAIDLDSVVGAVLEHNHIGSFFGFNSDGIDLGQHCRDIIVRSNIILTCSDKGISVGQGSDVLAENNLIVGCGQGFGIKDLDSYAAINQNTLYGNLTGIACFEKNPGKGGGSAHVDNTIITGSTKSAVYTDSLSTLLIAFSLSDTDTLMGENNLMEDPLFASASDLDFFLADGSPCIDNGTPNQQDPDGSRADIGAYISHPSAVHSGLRINEINFAPHSNFNSGDWIEFYNAGEENLVLSGWTLRGENLDDEFFFPDRLELESGAYLLAVKNEDLVRSLHGPLSLIKGRLPFGLSSDGEWLRLYDSNNRLVHTIQYRAESPWPDGPRGKGATLEFYREETDNSQPENWHASHLLGGTPGEENSLATPVTGLEINELMAKNDAAFADEKGEYDDWLEIYNQNDFSVNLGGLYLIPNNQDGEPWMIPLYDSDSTTLGPEGFKLIWADKDPEQGILHTGFNLPASGGKIGLGQVIGKELQLMGELSYSSLATDKAFGRYPDGGDLITGLNLTPGGSNRLLTSLDPGNKKPFRVYPNPANTFLIIEHEQFTGSMGLLRNMSGQTLRQFQLETQGFTRIDISGFEPGIYLLQFPDQPSLSVRVLIM